MSKGVSSVIFENFGVKLLSLLIAFVMWSVVIGSRPVEVEKKVPVEIITPPNLVVVNDPPREISFRLRGPKTFLRVVLDRREEPIKVDLSRQQPGLVTYRFFSDSIHVPIQVKVLSNNPAAILIKLEEVAFRRVPVNIQFSGEPEEGYFISDAQVIPKEVTIKGAESRVKKVSEISTLPIDVAGLKQGFEKEVTLDLIRHRIELDGVVPRVKVDIKPLTANFKIRDVKVRVKSKYRKSFQTKQVTVYVYADGETLSKLNSSKVTAEVDLTDRGKGNYKEKINVKVPEGVKVVTVEPADVWVKLY